MHPLELCFIPYFKKSTLFCDKYTIAHNKLYWLIYTKFIIKIKFFQRHQQNNSSLLSFPLNKLYIHELLIITTIKLYQFHINILSNSLFSSYSFFLLEFLYLFLISLQLLPFYGHHSIVYSSAIISLISQFFPFYCKKHRES